MSYGRKTLAELELEFEEAKEKKAEAQAAEEERKTKRARPGRAITGDDLRRLEEIIRRDAANGIIFGLSSPDVVWEIPWRRFWKDS